MTVLDFLSGAVGMGFLISSLFFLRFWTTTRDHLFLVFAVSFLLLSVGQALQTLSGIPIEERSGLFILRLAAFLLIIVAILRKNLGPTRND